MRDLQLSMLGRAAYSIDLRHKILSAWERRLASQRALADLFGVSVSFVEKLIRRYRTTGDLAPKPHAGGPRRRLDMTAATLIRRLMHDHADLS
jgi:transposase